jgi:hypothetical protein
MITNVFLLIKCINYIIFHKQIGNVKISSQSGKNVITTLIKQVF